MKRNNFSKAEQGKFYRPIEELEIPVYLDKEIKAFYSKKALKTGHNQAKSHYVHNYKKAINSGD